jgi:hypoxanthine phosphoribosyltransferase
LKPRSHRHPENPGAQCSDLLQRFTPRAEEVEADYVGFGIGDEFVVGFGIGDGFVVGYGLDYQGKYRNLPYVGMLKMSAAV